MSVFSLATLPIFGNWGAKPPPSPPMAPPLTQMSTILLFCIISACKTCSNCDEVTGECKCPPGVYGDKCDKCKPGTYGYDQVVGCRPCKCDKTGTKNGDQKCDVATGQCMCNENFGGRQCSACRAGFFGFPVCKKCFCNEAGVTEKKCDANSGSCLCKVKISFH